MQIRRFYEEELGSLLMPGKVLALYGPRRAGKTTLLRTFLGNFPEKFFHGNGEDASLREVLGSGNAQLIKSSFFGYDLVVIDEAQAIKNIGNGLKMLVDELPQVKVIASGSSSFDLANRIGEPLTGRKRTRTLFPLSATEIAAQFGNMVLRQKLDELLIFGSYPEIFTTESRELKIELLCELRDSYLFKDILAYDNVRNADKLRQIVALLAFQVGKEVSLNELSRNVGLSVPTIERYLDLLEKTFVIFKISGFSRNLRSEITKTCRYFFWDNGVMNAVVNNFNLPALRNDLGALWENFLVSERIKKQTYTGMHVRNYFWRTYAQQEVDWVEESDGKLRAFEFKRNPKAKTRIPAAWKNAYPEAEFSVITPLNFTEFIC
ncbi:MAG: ATP-binding protein [Opitutales bacterium]|nr:ATP-binding protein [Opitutales bacterium]